MSQRYRNKAADVALRSQNILKEHLTYQSQHGTILTEISTKFPDIGSTVKSNEEGGQGTNSKRSSPIRNTTKFGRNGQNLNSSVDQLGQKFDLKNLAFAKVNLI